MKKIIVAIALLFSITLSAQSKTDLIKRGESVLWSVDRDVKKGRSATEDLAYAIQKLEGIKPIFKISGEDEKKFTDLFKSQYPAFAEKVKKYDDTRTLQSKLDLIKLLVDNEESFRDMLTKDQLVSYIDYANEHYRGNGITYLYLHENFLSQKQLESFKKELQ
ncbi:hypothetical protein [Flavobacterium sp.]|uniref:hypothetical protein n=1 Tax=Flavobacterium sp. TaxID=239 RepID=UPI004034F245